MPTLRLLRRRSQPPVAFFPATRPRPPILALTARTALSRPPQLPRRLHRFLERLLQGLPCQLARLRHLLVRAAAPLAKRVTYQTGHGDPPLRQRPTPPTHQPRQPLPTSVPPGMSCEPFVGRMAGRCGTPQPRSAAARLAALTAAAAANAESTAAAASSAGPDAFAAPRALSVPSGFVNGTGLQALVLGNASLTSEAPGCTTSLACFCQVGRGLG